MTVDSAASVADIEVGDSRATIRFERNFSRPRNAVWAALTQPAQLEAWLAEASVDLRVGGEFVVRFSDAPMHGRITDLIDNSVLGYSWHEGQDAESHVRWELADSPDGGTILRLIHTRLMSDSAPGFGAGWHHHLERFAAHLAGEQLEWSDERFAELHAMYQARQEPGIQEV